MLPEVLVHDIDVDAALVSNGAAGVPVLVLRPNLTPSSAVRAIRRVVPTMHIDHVRALVRRHLPHSSEIEDLIGEPAPLPVRTRAAAERHLSHKVWLAAAAVLAAILAVCTFGLTRSATPASGPLVNGQALAMPRAVGPAWTRDSAAFDSSGASCQPATTSNMSLCDYPLLGHGTVETYPGTLGVKYLWSFGEQVATINSFNDPSDARRFYSETRGMYTHVVRRGPWVVAGTDQNIVAKLTMLLNRAARATHTSLR